MRKILNSANCSESFSNILLKSQRPISGSYLLVYITAVIFNYWPFVAFCNAGAAEAEQLTNFQRAGFAGQNILNQFTYKGGFMLQA